MIIAIDLDDVLANTLEVFIKFHNQNFGTNLKFKDFKSYALHDIIGISEKDEAKRLELFDNSEFFDEIKPIKDAQQAISALSKKNKITVITARTLHVADKTKKWLSKYFPEINQIFFISSNYYGYLKTKAEVCKEIGAGIIIEDKEKFVIECAREGIKVLLFDYPWNSSIKGSRQIIRVKSWKEVIRNI